MDQPGHDASGPRTILYQPLPSSFQRADLPSLQPLPDQFSHADWGQDRRSYPSQSTHLRPSHHHHHQHHQHHQHHHSATDGLASSDSLTKHEDHNNNQPEDGMASTSDFVKKLYKMLEDQSFQHVVSWGPQGDCFVVKDMNEFTKSILPRMFKHSNFASFVRQLNKYDFHKVKNTDDNQFGEHSWTFRHPDFHADRRDALENIKRKVPTQRKSMPTQRSTTSSSPGPYSSSQVDTLQHQVDRLTQAHDDMSAHVRSLERSYQDVLVEMVNFQRNMAQQDNLMQNLIQYFLNSETAKAKRSSNILTNLASNNNTSTPFNLPAPQERLLLQREPSGAGPSSLAPSNGAGATSQLWQDAANAGLLNPQEITSGTTELEKAISRQEALSKLEELRRQQSSSAQMLSALYGMVGKGIEGIQRVGDLKDNGGAPDSIDPGLEPRSTSARWNAGPDPSEASSSATVSSSTPSLIPGWKTASGPSSNDQLSQQGLEVYTLANLMPKGSFDNNGGVAGAASAGGWAAFDTTGLGVDGGLSGLLSAAAAAGGRGVDDGTLRFGDPSGSLSGGGTSSGIIPTNVESLASVGASSSSSPSSSAPSTSQQKLRVRRTTIVPAWTVPPRVLLVDDDAVSRKLSSKFLQVFGCTIDVAVDGVGAVNKMNIEKYDLVLMDIVMPKLDGISATSIIRGFDRLTPIISMTSNSKPNEIMTYFSSGMNDILPKPFTKQSLLQMLEKHLMHLTMVQQMSQVPRSVGVPPLSDRSFEQALTTHAAAITNGTLGSSLTGHSTDNGAMGLGATSGGQLQSFDMNNLIMGNMTGDDDDDVGRANPLASMGLSDDMYQMMLQNLINTGQFPDSGGAGVGLLNVNVNSPGLPTTGVSLGFKRSLDDGVDGPGGKRGRFEVLE